MSRNHKFFDARNRADAREARRPDPGAAHRIIDERAQASAGYRAAFALAVTYSADEFDRLNLTGDPVERIAAFRAAGGTTEIAKRAIARACAETPEACVACGSALIPTTPADVLRRDYVLVRNAADRECWARTRARSA